MKYIKTTIIFIFIILIVNSCGSVSQISQTSGLSIARLNTIPSDANIVKVYKEDISAIDFYDEVFNILLSRGHRISKDDAERLYITTEGKDVGESTLQRMNLLINEVENGSQLVITTEWRAGTQASAMAVAISGLPVQSQWEEASWEISRLGVAFAESVAIAVSIENGIISYD